MPKIIDHVLARKKQIVGDVQVADDNQRLAEAAVLGGIQSKAWRIYMEQYCDQDENGVNEEQIARLTATDSVNAQFNRQRAYLVSNAMCGDFSKEHFEVNVESIDEGLNVPGTQPGCNANPPVNN